MGFDLIHLLLAVALAIVSGLFFRQKQKTRRLKEGYRRLESEYGIKLQRITASSKRPLKLEQMWSNLQLVRLSHVKQMIKWQFPDWKAERIHAAFVEYRKLLFLYGVESSVHIVPWSEDLASVWRAHILASTERYEDDCRTLFGELLHYTDQGPLSDPRSTGQKIDVINTKEVYARYFVPPSNAPSQIREQYDGKLPWATWWLLFAGDHPEFDYSQYDPVMHTFETDSSAAAVLEQRDVTRYAHDDEAVRSGE